MAQKVVRGGQIRLSVQFYEHFGGPPVDPSQDITLDILQSGSSVLPSILTYPASGIIRKSVGLYEYTYNVPENAVLGEHIARWTGEIYATDVTGDEAFEVVAAGSITTGTEVNAKLGEDYVVNYVAELNPAFVDPEQIATIFPEADLADILESIHRASLEVANWIPNASVDTLPPLAFEYVRAAAACDLSQRFGYGDGDAYSITLGDLSVTNRNISKGDVTRGNAVTWCEIAAALRKEMSMKFASMKGVVRGAKYDNPIPSRSIDKRSSKPHPQGTLDDVQKPPRSF